MTSSPDASAPDARPLDARALADEILHAAVARRASDIHLEPSRSGWELRLRVDGVLTCDRRFDTDAGRALAARFMVMAKLLTYRPDVPQEGRAAVIVADVDRPLNVRISMMPTTHGPRIAVRLPGDLNRPFSLDDLRLPDAVSTGLKRFAGADSGLLIVTGPAGSGKTTTVYAFLRYLAESATGISIVTLEDPVESDLPGITQIEVMPFGERTYDRCLRSMLRQDPQVLMLGEIRDAATASLAVQAALSGHRLICTLHAATAGGAVARLIEMGVEPYQLTSSLSAIITQRLVRRTVRAGLYEGRVPLAEIAVVDAAARAAILRRADRDDLQNLISAQPGFVSLVDCAADLVRRGLTDDAELRRVGIHP